MNLRHEAHRACVVVRLYPTTGFWLMACAVLAASLGGNTFVLVLLLIGQLGYLVHMARRMWSPPVLMSLSRRDQPATLIPTIPRQPGPHFSERRRHRHARR